MTAPKLWKKKNKTEKRKKNRRSETNIQTQKYRLLKVSSEKL